MGQLVKQDAIVAFEGRTRVRPDEPGPGRHLDIVEIAPVAGLAEAVLDLRAHSRDERFRQSVRLERIGMFQLGQDEAIDLLDVACGPKPGLVRAFLAQAVAPRDIDTMAVHLNIHLPL
jgi:hypothetical protein